jgi:hypothetical protein
MSIISTLRDYTEIANNLADSFGDNFTIVKFLSEFATYGFKTLQITFIYIVTFQWIRDFSLLPILIPETTERLLAFPKDIPTFGFLEIPSLFSNKLVLGFCNSFFLSLPVSVVHIITTRRLLIQGIPAAVYSIGGYLLGQWLFLCCTIFGIRAIIIPWLSFEPLNYFLGFILLFRIIQKMFDDGFRENKSWTSPQYRDFFITTFLLAWCEQTSVFQYFGNLTLAPTGSLIESFTSINSLENFLTHTQYVVGVGLGTIFFSCLWGSLVVLIRFFVFERLPLIKEKFMQSVHYVSIVLLITLGAATIPFYGFDYLLTGPLGFISNDKAFENTFLYQYDIPDFKQPVPGRKFLKTGLLGKNTMGQSIEIDHTPFNNGRYLVSQDDQNLPTLSYEDLNFRGDAAVCHKEDKKARMAGFIGSLLPKKLVEEKTILDANTLKNDNEKIKITETKTYIPSSPIQKRFSEWYNLASFIPDPEKDLVQISIQKLSEMTMIFFRNTLPLPLDDKIVGGQEAERERVNLELKRRFYLNPTYQKLLKVDIDFFLNREPKKFKLSGDQEFDLYNKRRQLFAYWNSAKSYSKLPYTKEFDRFFNGSKTFAHKVYNQQFRGTLRNVRRLFSIALADPHSNIADSSLENRIPVLKFDQPLYTFSNESRDKSRVSLYHEELLDELKENLENVKFRRGEPHENSAKLGLVTVPPLYAGWDENSRQFVLTNKLLPFDQAGREMTVKPDLKSKFASDLAGRSVKTKMEPIIRFTTWPLSTETVLVPKKESTVPYVTLFFPKLDEEPGSDEESAEQSIELREQLLEGQFVENIPSSIFLDPILIGAPANFESLLRLEPEESPYFLDAKDKNSGELSHPEKTKKLNESTNLIDYLAPKNGGFFWPGSQSPPNALSEEISDIRDWLDSTLESTKNFFPFLKKN